MANETKKEMGKWAATGLGCLLDIGLMVVLALALTEERMISTFVWAAILFLPFIILKVGISRSNVLPGKLLSLVGPVFLLICALLAFVKPFKIEDDSGKEVVATPKNVAEKITSKKGDGESPQLPAGVTYSPASTNAVSVEEALAELDELVGLQPVKEEVKKFVAYVQVAQKRKEAGLKVAPISYHMVFTGNPGTGKTTVARIMAKIYHALGIVKKGHLVETDRSGLVAGYVGQTAEQTNKVVDKALDGVLFVDEAYALAEGGQGDYGGEAIATLLKRMEDDRDRLVVIVAGYTDDMKKFIDANPGLKSRFNRYLEFPDYSASELAQMFRLRAKKNQYVLAPELDSQLVPALEKLTRKRDKQFGNGRFVRNLFENAVERQAMRLASATNPTPEELTTLTVADVDLKPPEEEKKPTIEEALAELDALVGMAPVKAEVRRLVAWCKMAKERKAKGLDVAKMSYHFVFTGNPGTGKTTVARILAKIFRALGILERGQLVETDRSGLVAEYVGQTAAKTNRKIDEALDGLLFIDEAYALVDGGQNDYGKEAIATLIKRMEDDRDRLVVILAGYTQDMERFMEANPGLKSRFNRTIEFPDYTPEELAAIYRQMAKKSKYILSDDVEKWLDPWFRVTTKNRDRHFGNGREVRNRFEKALERQSLRVSELVDPTPEQLMTLERVDVGIRLKDDPVK
ncbi:MAG: AAA family ATPase [Kiritimatiellae bacterium]|nr:AAA family ATPase [Kiritimatiellia bacterium]